MRPIKLDGLTKEERNKEALRLLTAFRKTGDMRLREQVYTLFAHLARLTLKQTPHLPQDEEDLLQVARCALIEAIDAFDAALGSFRTFAISKMRFACLEYLRGGSWGSRCTRRKERARQNRRLELENGAPPTRAEVEGGWPVETQVSLTPISLDAARGHCSGEDIAEGGVGVWRPITLYDQVASPVDCEAEALERLGVQELRRQVAALPERERRAVVDYYWRGRSLQAIAHAFGVSESRAFQLRGQGLARLRRLLAGLPPLPDRRRKARS